MTLVVCWLVYPAVMVALCLGCGLLVDALAGRTVPGALRVPVGVATIVVVAQFTTWSGATAKLTTPLLVLLAIGGVVVRRDRLRRPTSWAPYAAAAAVYAVYAAPIVLTGEPSWAGFVKLDDTATWLTFTDRLFDAGYGYGGLDPSTYREVLRANFRLGYPVGAFLAFGAGRPLVGQDLAWIFQPHLAFLAGALALALQQLLAGLRLGPWTRAGAAFVAAQAATLYAYVMWGGIKEVLAALLLALLAGTLPPLWAAQPRLRAGLPLAVAGAAFFAVFGPPSGAWLGPLALVASVPALWRAGLRRVPHTLARLGATGTAALLLALPTILIAWHFRLVGSGLAAGGTPDEDIGNLFGPLDLLQVLGVWPVGDFRTAPEAMGPTHLILAVLAVSALAGVGLSVRRGAWSLLAYAAFVAAGSSAALAVGGTWIDGKTMAMTSPVAVALALGGALAVVRGRATRGALAASVLGGTAAAAVTAGVLWSSALTYDEVSPAPHERMAELEEIGERFAGQGPALFTEYTPFAARHFLRSMDPEGATELRWRDIRLADGSVPPPKASMEIDDFALRDVLAYRTLVLRRMPTSSRPPSAYRRVWSGDAYDVWRREQRGRIVEHVPFGDAQDAAAVPPCSELRRLARVASDAGGRVVAAVRATSVLAPVEGAQLPAAWPSQGAGAVVPKTPDTAVIEAEVPRAGSYSVWLGGTFGRGITVLVDGREVGRLRDERQHAGQYLRTGAIRLFRGRHLVSLRFPSDGLRPGDGDTTLEMGPVLLSPDAPAASVRTVEPARVESLCRTALDWAEVVVP